MVDTSNKCGSDKFLERTRKKTSGTNNKRDSDKDDSSEDNVDTSPSLKVEVSLTVPEASNK